MKTVKEITAAETYPVRHPVLRPGKPVESCHFEGDDGIFTKHFGVFIENDIVGVASIYRQTSDLFDIENQIQLRGMAVLEEHRGKGFGEALVKHCENYAKEQNDSLLWLNARVGAVGFYQNMGYLVLGQPFHISGVGEHYIMYKIL